MSGSGLRPTQGARYALERVGEGEGEELVYRGFVHLPDEDVAVDVRVELPSGATTAALTGGEPTEAGVVARNKELSRMAAAFIRSATRANAAAGGPFPRKIVRWRTL